MAQNPDWSLYRVFLAAMREGSLSAAGRALGMSQPTVSRHIRALEQVLGYPLFVRSPDGLRLTEAALALAPHVRALAETARALARAASTPPGTIEGTIRIAVSEVVAAELLPALLQDFHAKWPGLAIEIFVSNREADILRGAADIAIRMVRPRQAGLFAKRCGTSELGLYAHPAYLEGRPVPTSRAELVQHRLIGFDEPRPYTRTLAIEGALIDRASLSLRSDSDMAQLSAIRAGLGIGVCHAIFATGLTRVMAATFCPCIDVWLVMHEDMKASVRLKTLFDVLGDGLKASLSRRPGV